MKGYTHLKWNDRLYLERLLKLGYRKSEIAKIIGCSVATVYNELKRGLCERMESDLTVSMKYDPYFAQQRYYNNLKAKGKEKKLLQDRKLQSYIGELIGRQGYSPEAVIMEIRNNELKFDVEIKSTRTIYAAIREGIIKGIHLKDLPRKGKIKQKKKKIEPEPAYWKEQRGKSIEIRPKEIEDRSVFGHWEMDSVIGKSTNRRTVLVLTERKTRTEIVEKMKFHNRDEVIKALNRIEKRLGADFYKIFRSITVDNGSEFKDYIGMEKALRRKGKRTDVYYCHARSPNERGSNENNNILLRRYKGLGKGTDFDKVLTTSLCKEAEEWINTYPRRIFGGLCSLELFNRELARLGCRPLEY